MDSGAHAEDLGGASGGGTGPEISDEDIPF